MSSVASLTVIAAVSASCAVAVIGWLLGVHGARANRPDVRPSKRWQSTVRAFVVLGAIGAAIAAPVVAVLWIVVALNHLLGRRESVPFSSYSMFSKPSATAWALRFEDSKGQLVAIAKIGLAPHTMRKRFATELRAARRQGINDVAAARRCAAEVLARLLEQHRPPKGPLAASPITIVLVEYVLDSGRLLTVNTPILQTTPP